jgi:hypothetical protein
MVKHFRAAYAATGLCSSPSLAGARFYVSGWPHDPGAWMVALSTLHQHIRQEHAPLMPHVVRCALRGSQSFGCNQYFAMIAELRFPVHPALTGD